MIVTRLNKFETQVFLGYKCKNGRKTHGRAVGEWNDLTMETWGFEGGSKGVISYTQTANGVSIGDFIEGKGFVADHQRTEEARKKIRTLAPRLFITGTRSEFVVKVDGEELLRYEPLENVVRNWAETDYLAQTENAWKFRRAVLNDMKYKEGDFHDDIRSGKLIWFERAPSKEHLKHRPKREKNYSITSLLGNVVRLYRLMDLMVE